MVVTTTLSNYYYRVDACMSRRGIPLFLTVLFSYLVLLYFLLGFLIKALKSKRRTVVINFYFEALRTGACAPFVPRLLRQLRSWRRASCCVSHVAVLFLVPFCTSVVSFVFDVSVLKLVKLLDISTRILSTSETS